MPASVASRLAQLRAHATGESHARASQLIESVPPATPILSEPSPAQEQLEGAIFDKMYGLCFIPRQPNKHRFKPFGIRSVTPSMDRLVIELEEWSGYEEFAMSVMPRNREGRGRLHSRDSRRSRPPHARPWSETKLVPPRHGWGSNHRRGQCQ